MAATAITNVYLTLGNASAMPVLAALTAADGALVEFSGQDTKHLILIENTSVSEAATAVIKKGNALQGVADLEISIAASTTVGVVVESGPYKNVSGDNKGKLLIVDSDATSTALKVGCVVLP